VTWSLSLLCPRIAADEFPNISETKPVPLLYQLSKSIMLIEIYRYFS